MMPGLKTQKVGNHWSKTLISQIQVENTVAIVSVLNLAWGKDYMVPLQWRKNNPYNNCHWTAICCSLSGCQLGFWKI